METKLQILSNEDAISKTRQITAHAIQQLQTMSTEPISKIESFLEETLDEIRKVDLAPEKKIISEIENEKLLFLNGAI